MLCICIFTLLTGQEIIADINARECGAEGNDTICRNDDYYIRVREILFLYVQFQTYLAI